MVVGEANGCLRCCRFYISSIICSDGISGFWEKHLSECGCWSRMGRPDSSLLLVLFSFTTSHLPIFRKYNDDSVEVVYLCPGKEKRKAYTYETIDVFQQGKGKRDRITFARKGAFLPSGPCLNQYNGWSAEKRAEVIEALTEKGIKVRHP